MALIRGVGRYAYLIQKNRGCFGKCCRKIQLRSAIYAPNRDYFGNQCRKTCINAAISVPKIALIPKLLQTNRIHLAKNTEKSLQFGKSRAKNGLIRLLRPKNLVYSTINAKSPNTGNVCFFMGTICGHSRINVHCRREFINPGRKFMHPPVRQHRLYAEIHGNLDRGL